MYFKENHKLSLQLTACLNSFSPSWLVTLTSQIIIIPIPLIPASTAGLCDNQIMLILCEVPCWFSFVHLIFFLKKMCREHNIFAPWGAFNIFTGEILYCDSLKTNNWRAPLCVLPKSIYYKDLPILIILEITKTSCNNYPQHNK